MKRAAVATVLAIASALLLASAGETRAVKEGGTFKIAVPAGFFNTFDPALISLAAEQEVLQPVCESLVDYPSKPPPEGLKLEPELAEADPVVSKDGKTYTFTIRKDARFSTGAPVTAQAIVRAIERRLDPVMETGDDFLASLIVGGEDVLAGKTKIPSGLTARGRTLTVRLTRSGPDFLGAASQLCAVPPALPTDPEGAKAPLASPGPYYVSEFAPGQRIVLTRNQYYKGSRPHHVDRFTIDLAADEGSIVDEVMSGKIDWGWVTVSTWSARAAELAQRYGVNKAQFFVMPGNFLRMFVLNTSRPLFRNNPKLRQAVNFAVDRKALVQTLGPYGEAVTDQYLKLRNDAIYPLKGPDLKRARALAKGHTRSGKAIFYTRQDPVDIAQAQILQRDLKAIGIDVQVVQFPTNLIFDKLAHGQQEFDIGRIAWSNDDSNLLGIFDGRLLGADDNVNFSYFNSLKVNDLLTHASHLSGTARYAALAELDTLVSRDFAPAIPIAYQSAITLVSRRTGCAVMNPFLDPRRSA